MAAADATREGDGATPSPITAAEVTRIAQRKVLLYDQSGEEHFNLISALHKSLRESDVDASIYYLAAMLAGGEDPRFIARRMVIFASEDVGNAAPQALAVATAAAAAVDRVGLPEGRINLAQAAVYLALAPKSNASYKALLAAEEHVRRHGAAEPPAAIRDSHYAGARELGRGVGYRYPHDEPGGVSDQRTMPEAVGDARFYAPTDRGFEAELAERLARLRALRASPETGADND
jgi:putative ATPase